MSDSYRVPRPFRVRPGYGVPSRLAALIFGYLSVTILAMVAIPSFLLMLGSVYWTKHHPGTWLAIIGDLLALLLISIVIVLFVQLCNH
jgi:hypothetical protein